MTTLHTAPEQTDPARMAARRHRAELIADIAASAIPYRGRLRDLADFHERDALRRPSILRRVTDELAPAIPHGTDRILSIGWPASVLATALSLHAGVALAVLPTDGRSSGDPRPRPEGINSGEVVALVTESGIGADVLAAVGAALASDRIRPVVLLSVLPVTPGGLADDVRRFALLTRAELDTAIPGSTQ